MTDIDAFLASGGKITKIETGASAGLTNRDWRGIVRGHASPLPTEREYLWEMGFVQEAKNQARGR